MKFEDKTISLKFGVLSKTETRDFNGIICPYCHEHYTFNPHLRNLENFDKIKLQDFESDGSTCCSDIECPDCHKNFEIWADTTFYAFKP